MAITKRAFPSANSKRVWICCLLVLGGCRWQGVRPIFARITLHDQVDQAAAVIFSQVIESRFLHHEELIPTFLHKESAAEQIWCVAVEKVLRIRQVLKGSVQAGTLLRMITYEVRGIPGMTTQPAIFFLIRQGDAWRPPTDFDRNTITLPGFPDRPLVLTSVAAGPAALDRVLIDALLDPRNASGWPEFKDKLLDLYMVASQLAQASGILASEPGFLTDRLVALANSADRDVAVAGRKALLPETSICNERKAFASEWAQTNARNLFLQDKTYADPGKSPEQREETYWNLKMYSCSRLPEVRSRAEALLHRYFSDRKTVGCEICSGS